MDYATGVMISLVPHKCKQKHIFWIEIRGEEEDVGLN